MNITPFITYIQLFFQREWYIALHAEPLWVQIIKLPIFSSILYFAWKIRGAQGVMYIIFLGIVLEVIFHFFLRYMTHGWTQAWLFFPQVSTPYDASFFNATPPQGIMYQ